MLEDNGFTVQKSREKSLTSENLVKTPEKAMPETEGVL